MSNVLLYFILAYVSILLAVLVAIVARVAKGMT